MGACAEPRVRATCTLHRLAGRWARQFLSPNALVRLDVIAIVRMEVIACLFPFAMSLPKKTRSAQNPLRDYLNDIAHRENITRRTFLGGFTAWNFHGHSKEPQPSVPSSPSPAGRRKGSARFTWSVSELVVSRYSLHRC